VQIKKDKRNLKMAIDVNVEDIVRNLGKNIKFNQPMYEAIINSLEANATKITIEIHHDSPIEGVEPKITGFKISDNGEGFIEKNRVAFTKLWTDNKATIGCKGSGRFTWLSVFEQIEIESFIVSEQKHVFIPFNKQFSRDSIQIEDGEVKESSTILTFRNITDKFLRIDNTGELIDKRPVVNVMELRNDICEYLLVKLFFLKKENVEFQISIICDSQKCIIDKDSIPDLNCVSFNIQSEITQEFFNFQLYYHFFNDAQNSKRGYYCSNRRSTKQMENEVLGFSCKLPNKDSFIMLLCSPYFEDKDNDGRNDLTELSHQKNASIVVPLLLSDINPALKENIQQIINKQYPELVNANNHAIEAAKEAAPYLSAYFNLDSDIVKTKESLLVNARKHFAEVKIQSQKKFEKILNDRKIDPAKLTKEIETVSTIAAAELGEYILYRDNIIKALLKAIGSEEYDEKYVHDIFMPMKTDSFGEDSEKYLLSNLWLLDDKFMTYSYAASDKTVNHIKTALGEKVEKFYGRLNRPDLSLFFNKKDGRRDVIMVEFKGANADKDEKNKSLTELPIDIRIIRENVSEINSIWSYIITTIDDDLKYTIESLGQYTELFSKESDLRAYYGYNKISNAHIYIIDLRTIISDSFARNKTFLDILKKQ